MAVQTIALALLLFPGQGAAGTTGSLTITSTPPGVEVLLDGVSAGVTPLTTAVSGGTHQIAMQHGTGRSTHAIDVAAGMAASYHLELESTGRRAPVGDLQITSEPRGASIVVDGRRRGVTPATLTDLAVGSHSVTVSRAGATLTRTVVIEPATLSSLEVDLRPAPASGWIAITSSVPVKIYEKGAMLGSSNMPRIRLSAGSHVLELVNEELGVRTTRAVDIAGGLTRAITLDVPTGIVAVNALPWAEVWLGRTLLGETPLANVALPLGTHELVFKHPTLGEQRRRVVVALGSTVRVGIDLRKGTR